MARAADIWAKRKNGRLYSWYFRRTNLRTKDEGEARRRADLVKAGRWPEARVTSEKQPLEGAADGAAARGEGAPPPINHQSAGEDDWTADAPAGGPGSPAAAPGSPPGPSPDAAARAQADEENRQLSALVVAATFKGAELAAQKRVYEGFKPPPIAPAGRQLLEGQYFQLFTYADIGSRLPPWVRQIVMPVVTILGTTAYIFGGYADLAAQQKARAGGGTATDESEVT